MANAATIRDFFNDPKRRYSFMGQVMLTTMQWCVDSEEKIKEKGYWFSNKRLLKAINKKLDCEVTSNVVGRAALNLMMMTRRKTVKDKQVNGKYLPKEAFAIFKEILESLEEREAKN